MPLNAAVLTFREFVMKEELPLASIHAGVFEFLRDRMNRNDHFWCASS